MLLFKSSMLVCDVAKFGWNYKIYFSMFYKCFVVLVPFTYLENGKKIGST